MSTATQPYSRLIVAPMFDNGDEFLHSLGDVPMSRVVWNPWPGTATEQDLLEAVERGKRFCELVDGTLVEKPMGRYESFIAGWLITYLNIFLSTHEIGVVLGEAALLRINTGRVRAPDVSYFSFERLGGKGLDEERISSAAADLAVEVFSDGNTAAEMKQKKIEYFGSGTRLFWIIYPVSKTVEIFDSVSDLPTKTLNVNDTIDGGAVIPGFALELTKLFNRRTK